MYVFLCFILFLVVGSFGKLSKVVREGEGGRTQREKTVKIKWNEKDAKEKGKENKESNRNSGVWERPVRRSGVFSKFMRTGSGGEEFER
jgi:hypothetical protein